MASADNIDLSSELTFANAFRFPLQNAESRRELLMGAGLLLLPFVGWLLNMGHRIEFVHRMQHGRRAWPSWQGWSRLLAHGTITFLGMIYYYFPALMLIQFGPPLWRLLGVTLFFLATIAIPGFMSHYCRNFDPREIYDPFRALKRVRQGGSLYWKAWAIALTALLLSFTGLLFLGVGFLVTSVWFWQVAGYAFANVFTKLPADSR